RHVRRVLGPVLGDAGRRLRRELRLGHCAATRKHESACRCENELLHACLHGVRTIALTGGPPNSSIREQPDRIGMWRKSALGQERRFEPLPATSGLPSTTDLGEIRERREKAARKAEAALRQ